MNKLLRNVLICVISVILLLGGIYVSLVIYYKQVFPMNTWVNDVYCTGKTVEEVNMELLQHAEAPFLTIRDNSGEDYKIKADAVGLKLDYSTVLNELLSKSRNSFYWPLYLVEYGSETIVPEITYDKELLKYAVEDLPFVAEEISHPGEVEIILSDEGYVLKNTLKDRLNFEKMYHYLDEKMEDSDFLIEGMKKGCLVLDLLAGECYEDIMPDAKQWETLKRWNDIKSYIDSGIVYDMGDEQIALKGKIASSFIKVDDKGEICFDSDGQPKINFNAIENFVNSLTDAYNTYGKELTFISTAGETKVIPYVTYGTELDLEAEIKYLTDAFVEKRSEIHVPAYKRKGFARGKNDIGDTYIEIDMGNQKLHAYFEGECIVETEIVTGNVRKKWSTPEGVVSIYKKQRNRTLRGPGYASFVKYWMPVKGGIGLHDASWRKEFGGEIYKTDGSHGCINIQRDVMAVIYESFEVGTPVIMFY